MFMNRRRIGRWCAGIAVVVVVGCLLGRRGGSGRDETPGGVTLSRSADDLSGLGTVPRPGVPTVAVGGMRERTGGGGDDLAFGRFDEWFLRYASAVPEERVALEAEGVARAAERRVVMKRLIQTDPEAALAMAAPYRVRSAVSAAVASQLEERIGGRGELAVLAALPEPGRERDVTPVFRTAEIGGRHFDAFVYGRRLGEPTRRNLPLHGIAIDGQLAVSVDPVRVLDADEAAAAVAKLAGTVDPRCGVSGNPAAGRSEPTPVEVAGRTYYLCGANHIKPFNDQWVAAEGSGPTGGETGPEIAASAWTEGTKRLLIIRVDFPDLSLSLTDTASATLVSNLNVFYGEMSYGRTGFTPVGSGSDVTPILRMTNAAAWYGTNNYYNQLRSEARAAASAAGYTLGNYELDVICMGAVPGFGWAGLAYVGAAGAWLRNSFGTGVAGHEIGHNYGLNHATFWDTGGQSVLGPGTSVEYGDSFDTMGAASAGANHFNARYKAYLNWLRTNETVRVTVSGTYRIYAHDSPSAPGVRGLYVARNSQTNYWVEFRQLFTANRWMMNGAGLRTAMSGNQRSQLLDLTPGSADGKTDSPLVIGLTFSDPEAGVHITPIGKGGTTPESLDVVVNVGSFPGNLAPTVTVAAGATNVGTGVAVNFTASASDANGDTLAYYWDFGDGTFGVNASSADKSWTSAGDYVVRCVVTDMKGGTASDSVIVRVGAPTVYRVSGVVTDAGTPLAGVRVSVSGTRMTYTDSDGGYSLVNLPAGSYTVSASLYPYTLSAAGFTNPIAVGPDRTGVNFATSGAVSPAITTQPASQTVNPGATVTWTVAATGTAPLTYQWRLNGGSLAGATNASYTRTNVQSGDAGTYSVVVANAAGSVTSANAVLTVNTPPTILAQPQNSSVIAGTNVSFSVQAGGSTPLSFQWRRNGTNLPGATAATLALANVQPAQAGSYVVVVTNSAGAATSAVATLTVDYSLVASASAGGSVTISPNSAVHAPGAVVSVTAASTSAYVFSGWSGDASGTNNPLTVTLTTNKVIVANFASPVPELIVDNPAAVLTGTWSTTATGADKYGADYRLAAGSSSAATATATFVPNVTVDGRYDVYLWSPTIARPAGAVPVTVVSAEGSQTLTVDQTTGAGAWRRIGTALYFGAGTNGLVRLANNVGQGGKDVAADAVRLVYSTSQDSTGPIITSQPAGVTFTDGSDLQFAVTAVGAPPLTYQWRFNGGDVPGATNASLRLTGAGPAQAGNYLVAVANGSGAVTSAVAVATFNSVPVVRLTSPTNGASFAAPASFAVSAEASDNDGGVVRVELYNGATLLASDASSPYATSVSSLAAGNYTLRAVAVDNLGARSTNSVAISVKKTGRKGSYSGLYYETSAVAAESAGSFNLVTTDQGTFSGSVLSLGRKASFRGRLDGNGAAAIDVPRRNATPLQIAFVVTESNGVDQVTGTVTDGSWLAEMWGARAAYHAATNPAPAAGAYTFLLPGTAESTGPAGYGYGALKVTGGGRVVLRGTLPDGQRAARIATMSADGQWPLHLPLYGGAGLALGWLNFADRVADDLAGDVVHLRPGGASPPFYPGGFTNETILVGSRYTAPAGGEPVLDLLGANLTCEGNNGTGRATNRMSLIAGNKLRDDDNQTIMGAVSVATGLFNGQTTDDAGHPVRWRGAMLQKAGYGAGQASATNGTLRILIAPEGSQ